jgi:hypothetical protein
VDPRTARRAAALIGAVTLVLTVAGSGLVGAGRVGAAPPTDDPATSAGYATRWLAAQVTPGGFIEGPGDTPDAGDTLQTALALAAAGHEQATFDSIVGWLASNVDMVTGTGDNVDPGETGYLMLVVAAAHDDATDFGGVDLVSRLGGTLGAFEPGLYGSYASVGDPTYSGVFEQSLALMGLAAAGATEDPDAITWLADQQCGGAAEFNGAWMSYRAPATPPATGLSPCTAFDSTTFTGIDTNSTSLAYEALEAVHHEPAFGALAWLSRTQNSDGSWGFYVGNDGDPDSTALVIQAIVAGGETPTEGWEQASGTPLSALESFQLGCDAPASDRGALTVPGSGGAPNLLATEQGTWGLAQTAFPLGAVAFTPSPVPCLPTTTSTSTTSTTGVSPISAPAPEVIAAPSFTG